MSRLLSRQRKKSKQNPGFVFHKRRSVPLPEQSGDERDSLIQRWLREHGIKKLPPGWSHYGWQI